MEKLTPRKLKCFREVALVIGDDEAEKELWRVLETPEAVEDIDTDGSLIFCFDWSVTPQGSRFWGDIAQGYVPKKSNNADKFKPTDLAFFHKVARIIGSEKASDELQKIIDRDLINKRSSDLFSAFHWNATPQGSDFWQDISQGKIPSNLSMVDVPRSMIRDELLSEQTQQVANNKDESRIGAKELKFGDKVHINGEPVIIVKYNESADRYVIAKENDDMIYHVKLTCFDEFRKNPDDEIRERVWSRWRSRGLNHAYDKEDTFIYYQMRDIINFVVENIKKEKESND